MTSVELIPCPEVGCGEIAEVVDRFSFDSTDGPISHIKVLCIKRHVLLMPEGDQ